MALPYIHVSLAERREIARMHAATTPISLIADRLQRHRSTIYREIKRNWIHDEEPLYRGYFHICDVTDQTPSVSKFLTTDSAED
ncbi:helix-turn-helix domain-containing protein [Microvirga sp. TS319]|uniref:helix-turn-helix domain-containing protein n=1 Tax=Microvirga sp. TS319 TaxID=3241165 RepID=UPI00351A4E59